MIHIVVAHDLNLAIGERGALPWPHLAVDSEHFKNLTAGKTVVMGRLTYESIGHALAGRRNIVLSSTIKQLPDAEVAATIDQVLSMIGQEDTWVIGGTEVYRAFMPYAEDLYITVVQESFATADTFFPPYAHQFTLAHESATVVESGIRYTFQQFSKNH